MNVLIEPFKENHAMESRDRGWATVDSSGLNPHFSNRPNLGESSIHMNKDSENQVPQSVDSV